MRIKDNIAVKKNIKRRRVRATVAFAIGALAANTTIVGIFLNPYYPKLMSFALTGFAIVVLCNMCMWGNLATASDLQKQLV